MLTLHHLDFSRSTRVLWLLEELDLPYELVRYFHAVGGPAPRELPAVHPSGKSPVLVDDGFVLAESSTILRYVDATYGGGRFTPAGRHAQARHDEWLDGIEGSLATAVILPLIAGHGLPDNVVAGFDRQRDQAWQSIVDAVGDDGFLMGSVLTLADTQLCYVLAVAAASGSLDGRLRMTPYLGRMMARPALQRATVAGGPMA